MGREKKDMNPVILKIGLALAFSLGGMLCTFIRNKRIKPSQPPSHPSKSADCNNQRISRRSSNSELHTFDPLATNKHNPLSVQDSYLLPEFNDLVKEFDLTAIKTNADLPISNTNSPPKVNRSVKTDSHNQEIKNLENMVKMLKERERNLEVRLLEYYGLKEQQNAVNELQNRLKLNNMEAKVFALKIEALETENKRLLSQMVDHNKVLRNLEAARAKINVLKKKLRSESAQNKERILDLQQRVEKMQEDELKLYKLKDLEDEVNALRKSNHDLQVEKSEFTRRLEHVQDQETEKLKKQSDNLKKQNEELTQEMEQLQADRCSDVEELVYMRWVNACLRYELRNYQPGPSKTMARDLSKSLSPRSEEKAKKLILKYANQELDPDQWSSPHSSNITNSSELDEPVIDRSSTRKTNNKFFGKFVKFLRGKDRNTPDHHHHSRNSSFERTESTEDMNSYSDYYSSKHSMDSRISVHRHSDFGMHNRIDSIDEGGDINDGFSGSPYSSDGQRSELVKYAEVLKDSSLKPPTRYRRRSKSFSSF